MLQAREDAASGAISADDLRGAEDDAIRDAVRTHEDIGLRSVTDDAFRRASWHIDFIYEISGVQKAEQNLRSGLTMDGSAPPRRASRMAGFARALRYLPLREDLIVRYGGGMNAQKQPIEQIRPGEVLVTAYQAWLGEQAS